MTLSGAPLQTRLELYLNTEQVLHDTSVLKEEDT